jgi:hypothetical protein
LTASFQHPASSPGDATIPYPVPVTLAIQIRWRDPNALGHVNNAAYLTYTIIFF